MTAGPAARVAAAWLPFTATFVLARGRRVARWEHRLMRRVNRWPDVLEVPLWTVMQAGTAGAPLVAGGVALLSGRPRPAVALAGSGLSAYALAKLVKRAVRRGRPEHLVPGVRIRGRAAGGDGYVSGHAAVAMALAVESLRLVPAPARPAAVGAAAVVAVARVYVGAHLPLDAVGGAALGLAISRSRSVLRRTPSAAVPTSGGVSWRNASSSSCSA